MTSYPALAPASERKGFHQAHCAAGSLRGSAASLFWTLFGVERGYGSVLGVDGRGRVGRED